MQGNVKAGLPFLTGARADLWQHAAMTRVLLIDDDRELAEMLVEYLGREDFTVSVRGDGPSGLEAARGGDADVIVLDVMLPGMDGFALLRELRRDVDTPVLMLTARGDDVDTIVGLEIGADDYLPKPFNPRLLVARLRALLRRGREPGDGGGQRLQVGDLVLDEGRRQVTRDGEPVALTGAEFNVLRVLLREAGHLVSRNTLCRDALGRALQPFDRSIDMHVSNLRRKLGPHADGHNRIETVRGAGYQYVRTG